MWKKGNPFSLLVEMKIDRAPMENIMEIPLKSRNKTTTAAAAAKSLQLCLTLCNPIDGSPPGPAIPGILQARTLE